MILSPEDERRYQELVASLDARHKREVEKEAMRKGKLMRSYVAMLNWGEAEVRPTIHFGTRPELGCQEPFMPAPTDIGPVSKYVQTTSVDHDEKVSSSGFRGITPLKRRVDPESSSPCVASQVDVGTQAPDKLGSGADVSKFIPLSVWPER